ncbi:MAG: DUF302 domain-containing protein [Candidatus Woesearchaeota archaeon]
MSYNYKKQVELAYADAVAKTKDALSKEGFGIITEIDVKATLKKKLNIDIDNYIILGACNPKLAHKAMQAEQDIGVLLPCNVVVYEKEGKTFVASILPTVQLGKINNKKLLPIAQEVEERLKRALNEVSDKASFI